MKTSILCLVTALKMETTCSKHCASGTFCRCYGERFNLTPWCLLTVELLWTENADEWCRWAGHPYAREGDLDIASGLRQSIKNIAHAMRKCTNDSLGQLQGIITGPEPRSFDRSSRIGPIISAFAPQPRDDITALLTMSPAAVRIKGSTSSPKIRIKHSPVSA